MRVRNLLLAGMVLGLSMVSGTLPAYAPIPTTCTNCSTIVDQLRQLAMQGKQLATEIKTGIDTANTYALAAQNTMRIPMSVLNQATALYNRTTNLSRSISGLMDSESPFMQRISMLRAIGSNAGGIPDAAMRSSEYWAKRAQDQYDTDAELLAYNNEADELSRLTEELSAQTGTGALGQLQMMQAQQMSLLAIAHQMNGLSGLLQMQIMQDMNRNAEVDAKKQDYTNFMGGLAQFRGQEGTW